MRRHNIRIYNQNTKLLMDDKIPIPDTIKVDYCDIDVSEENISRLATYHTSNVWIEQLKTDNCAVKYIDCGIACNVVVMNFASRIHHGGGYVRGATAQEEDLCRVMPQLFPSLCKIKYPFAEDSILVTQNLRIMRDSDNYTLLNKKYIKNISVVSAAAPNLKYECFDANRIKRTLKNMYISVKTLLPEVDTIILGAFGCGAYKNDSNIMSQIMNDINLECNGMFKNVIFSIPPGDNLIAFSKNITQL
jgi:uncharacterized protein (TIGR02452 family)